MARRITEEEYAKRVAFIKAVLAKNPDKPRNHFHRNCGWDYTFLDRLAKEEGIVFGKPKRSYSGWKIREG